MYRIPATALAAVGLAAALSVPATAAGAAVADPPDTAGRPVPAELSPEDLVGRNGQVITAAKAGADARSRSFDGTGRPGSIDEPLAIESIIGTDGRTRVSPTTTRPARSVGLIKQYGELDCTGWLVSRDTVITAGHCVRTAGPDGLWDYGLTFTAGADGMSSEPYGTCNIVDVYVLNGWLSSTTSTQRNNDGAVLKLDCSVGNTVGWFGMWYQGSSMNGLTTIIQGYPQDKAGTQWRSTDKVRASDVDRLWYQNDTLGGMSGSPVWQNRASGSSYCVGVCAMAIHTMGVYGTTWPASTHNSGTRITKAKYDVFQSVIRS